jgi:hypothetical protein
LIVRAIADGIDAGRQRVTPREMAGGARNGGRRESAPEEASVEAEQEAPAPAAGDAAAEPPGGGGAPAGAPAGPAPSAAAVADDVAAAPEYEVQSQGERAVEDPEVVSESASPREEQGQ